MTTRSRPSAPAITARASDVILAVLVTAAIAFIIATTPTGPVDAGAYVFALGFGTLMLLRRRLPRTVLVLTALRGAVLRG